jgi:Prophage CP4-57 regulatory protein (AlpA)
MYRRMRKALIREIAPDTALDWVEAEEYVISQYQSMRFGNWQKVIWEHCQWDGIKRAVKRRLRQRCPSDPEDELAQIAELIKRGEFPRPIRLSDGGRAKAWIEDELIIWQRQRLAQRDMD